MEHPENLFRGDDQHAKHQMGIDLVMAANPDMASAVIVLQLAVDPFGLTTGLIAFGFMRRKGNLLAAPGIVVNQRNVIQTSGFVTDNRTAIGRIGQVVELGDLLRTHVHQRQSHLTVVQRRRGQNRTDWDVAIRRVDVEFVADPGLPETLAVFLAAEVAGRR